MSSEEQEKNTQIDETEYEVVNNANNGEAAVLLEKVAESNQDSEARSIDSLLEQIAKGVTVAEADSTSDRSIVPPSVHQPEPEAMSLPTSKPSAETTLPTVTKSTPKTSTDSSATLKPTAPARSCETNKCSTCPFGGFCERVVKSLDAYPKARDLLLWTNPKVTGGVFGGSLVLLYCLASYSLLGVLGFLVLLTMTLVGSYRIYLAILFRIKGTTDETLNKLTSTKLALPKEKLQHIVDLVDSVGNDLLNRLKSLVLWENLYASSAAFLVAYLVYSIGCTFNTITLLTIGLIDAFTLPKIYVLYKVPIDAALNKTHVQINEVLSKVKARFPKLFPKKKTQ